MLLIMITTIYIDVHLAAYILRSGSAIIIEEKDGLGILKREEYEDIIAQINFQSNL